MLAEENTPTFVSYLFLSVFAEFEINFCIRVFILPFLQQINDELCKKSGLDAKWIGGSQLSVYAFKPKK